MRALPFALFLALLGASACGPGEEPAAKAPTEDPETAAAVPPGGPPPARRFPALPEEAEAAVLAVRKAAESGDLEALRPWMADGFSWSFGGDLDADQAIARWRDRPEVLRDLVAVIDRGCVAGQEAERVICPPEYGSDPGYLGYRAGFVRRPEGWRMTFFIAGD